MDIEIGLKEWLDQLAARQPTPGGGAVAALAVALSAALIGMVSIYTTGPKWVDQDKRMRIINDQAAAIQNQALKLMQADAEAFAQVGTAYAMPKASDTEKANRTAAIQKALIGAAEPPKQVMLLAKGLLPLLQQLAKHGNPLVISDVAVAANQAQAAIEAAVVNININRGLITDQVVADDLALVTSNATELIEKTASISHEVGQRILGQ